MGLVGNLMRVRPKPFASKSEQLATDPVCGMNVQIGKATKTEYRGEIFYFCCPHCQCSPGSRFHIAGDEHRCWDGAAYSRSGYQLEDYTGLKKGIRD